MKGKASCTFPHKTSNDALIGVARKFSKALTNFTNNQDKFALLHSSGNKTSTVV